MARLQATIDEDVMDILEQLLRRNDRARFIELAIKDARSKPDISKQFAWKAQKSSALLLEGESSNVVSINQSGSKVEFDNEFK